MSRRENVGNGDQVRIVVRFEGVREEMRNKDILVKRWWEEIEAVSV